MQRNATKFFGIVLLLLCATGIALAQKPTANFDASPLIGCAPLTVYFNDKSSSDVLDWEWDVNNDGIYDYVGDPVPIHVYTNPGTYAVRLTVSNFTDSATITKTKYIVVTAPITVNVPAFNECANDSFKLSATITGGLKPYKYFWSSQLYPNNSTSAQPVVSVDTTQTWTLDITDSLGCTGTSTFTIVALAVPAKPAIQHVLNKLTCSLTAPKYQWLRNGSAISGATTKTYTADTITVKSGYYQIRITNAAGCSATSDSILFAQLTDVAEPDLNEGWAVYPNPTKSDIFISSPISTSSISSIILFSPIGEKIREARVDERSGRIQVSVADIPSGVYVLRVSEISGEHIFRIVKE